FRDWNSGQPIPRHTWKGVLDLKDRKKDAYFFYQSRWTTQPMVHIAEAAWSPRPVWPGGGARRIEVFSNCDTVELLQNGRSLGGRRAADAVVGEVRFVAGVNRLEARGAKGAASATDAAEIAVEFTPPAPEVRLLPAAGGKVRLEWNVVAGVREYAVYAGDGA